MPDRTMPRALAPLLLAAMAIFVVTVVIGILNGTDIVTFTHNQLLAHVHAGTLGWITLSVFAGTAWILGVDRIPAALMWVSILAVALYVVAFWAGILMLRPFAGTLMLIMMFWFTIWAFGQRKGPWTVTTLAILLSLITLCLGGILGVLLGLKLSGMSGMSWIPEGISGGHPGMMVAGYLILAGTALAETLLGGSGVATMTKTGMWQVILLFGGGLALAIGLLLDILPLLLLNVLGEIIGVGFVVGRLRKQIGSAGWGVAGAVRDGATSVLFLVPAVLLLAYIIVSGAKDNFATLRPEMFTALDHLIFIGVLTNVIFAMLLLVGAARRAVLGWSDQVVYWGINLGVICFVLGLILDVVVLKRIGTPIMGLSILLGLLAAAMRLTGGNGEPASAPAEGSATG